MPHVNTEVRWYVYVTGAEKFQLLNASVVMGGTPLDPGAERLPIGHWIGGEPTRLEGDWLVKPDEMNGAVVLELRIDYTVGEKKYTASARYSIPIRRQSELPDVSVNVGDHDVHIGDGAYGGFRYNNVRIEGLNTKDEVVQYVNELLGAEGTKYERFVPVKYTVAELEESPSLPPAPTWPPTERARIVFDMDGVRYSYLLLAKSCVTVGRAEYWVKGTDILTDIRLYDWEYYWTAVEERQRQGKDKTDYCSAVSSRQCVAELKGNSLKVRMEPHVQALPPGAVRYSWYDSAGNLLKPETSCTLARGDYIEIPNRIGLKFATQAKPYANLNEDRQAAESVLEQMKNSLRPGDYLFNSDLTVGGIRLSRMHSLRGKTPSPHRDAYLFEAYVLIPGWATIGASKKNCIVIPAADRGVSDVHAYFLYVGGYFFVTPAHDDARVVVNGKTLKQGDVYPLREHSSILFGEVATTFEPFQHAVFEDYHDDDDAKGRHRSGLYFPSS